MGVPTRRILAPIFDKPTLQSGNAGSSEWTHDATKAQKGTTGWQAKLTGGVQSGDDYAAVYVPINELSVKDFNAAMWTYWLTNDETFGFNLVIWVHDPNDNNKRAEITQLGNVSGLAKDQYWNAHTLDTTVAQFFWFGEDYSAVSPHTLTGSGISSGVGTLSSWDDFQADALFGGWTIYRFSIEYGYEASGTFEAGWLTDLKFNGEVILLKPDPESQLAGYEFTINGINFNGYTKIKMLTLDADAEDDDPQPFNFEGSPYQVGATKVFIVFQALIKLQQTDLIGRIGEAESSGGVISKEVLKLSQGTILPFMVDCWGVFTSGKWITAETDSSSDTRQIQSGTVLYGAEVDA